MLPKINRLKKENDFRNVLRFGKKIGGEFLVLRIKKTDLELARFGIAVSKKVSKKATARNKLKRQMVSICGLYLPKTKKGSDIILFALPGLETKNFTETKEIIKTIFSKAGVIKNV